MKCSSKWITMKQISVWGLQKPRKNAVSTPEAPFCVPAFSFPTCNPGHDFMGISLKIDFYFSLWNFLGILATWNLCLQNRFWAHLPLKMSLAAQQSLTLLLVNTSFLLCWFWACFFSLWMSAMFSLVASSFWATLLQGRSCIPQSSWLWAGETLSG